MNKGLSAAMLFLEAHEERIAMDRQDWAELAATLETVDAVNQLADADLTYLVALVVNGHPHVDPGQLRAHATKLRLLAATMPNIGVVLRDPQRVAAALRAIADMVHVSTDWKPTHVCSRSATGPPGSVSGPAP